MIFYETIINSETNFIEILTPKEDEEDKFPFRRKNQDIYSKIALRLNEYLDETSDEFELYCYAISENVLKVFTVVRYEESNKDIISEKVKTIFQEKLKCECTVEMNEVTAETFGKKLRKAERKNYIGNYWNIAERYPLDFFNNNEFKIVQRVLSGQGYNFLKARDDLDDIMGDRSMYQELKRIYNICNPRKFLGHPVHYQISCGNTAAGYRMIDILVKSLLATGRLCSGQITQISNITSRCVREEDVENIVCDAKGGTIVIEMAGNDGETNYANAYRSVVEYFAEIIAKEHNDILFILLIDTEHVGFSKALASVVVESVDLIELKEGYGSREKAVKYLDRLIEDSSFMEYKAEAKNDIKLSKNRYTSSEVHTLFEKWSTECLRQNVYSSYKKCEVVKVDDDKYHEDAYTSLMKLVGLDDVKKMVNRIIAENVINKRRARVIGNTIASSKHMIFTGNPGSCKTTVARILATALKDEGVLDSGIFVECGRADLVGEYVGWTAKIVERKFRQASGGVLFIDEAYSLVDSSNSFGDEAINTIVQEMENHRDDVIVIFAGYPDKMKAFLDKNEGLRSRIAFHVDFPDYKTEELMQIFELMMEERHFTASEGALKAAREICEKACCMPEFGNGRFVRNMIEQAAMQQSVRIYEKYKGKKIPKKVLFELEESDFQLETLLKDKKAEGNGIGFRVA